MLQHRVTHGNPRSHAPSLTHQVLKQVVPELDPSFLRALLLYLGAWDPSEHALLSRKHFLAALRGEPPPASLQPPPPGALAAAGGAGGEGEELPPHGRLVRMHCAACCL